jgi:hypothetical protein
MGTVEMMLLMEYGIPLAVKLLQSGKDTAETTQAVQNTITTLQAPDVAASLASANPEQKTAIVDAIASAVNGAEDAVSGIVAAIGKLFGK